MWPSPKGLLVPAALPGRPRFWGGALLVGSLRAPAQLTLRVQTRTGADPPRADPHTPQDGASGLRVASAGTRRWTFFSPRVSLCSTLGTVPHWGLSLRRFAGFCEGSRLALLDSRGGGASATESSPLRVSGGVVVASRLALIDSRHGGALGIGPAVPLRRRQSTGGEEVVAALA